MINFYQFQEMFPDDDACLHQIMVSRYGGTRLECPKCKRDSKFHKMKKQPNYVCQFCGHHLYPCAGTPFERSRTPLHKWFYAMYLFSASRHGISAKELQRQLGVTYKTAWRMAHEIRKYMAQVDDENPLDGEVEADETYIGGKRPGKRGRGADGKAVVFGMMERGGELMAKVVPNVRKRTLQPIIYENILPGSTVHTDELRSYMGLARAGYEHRTVNHGAGEYVKDGSHVNSLEGFWSRLKLSIQGTHVHVSPKHLWKYVKEFEYRYNRRKDPASIFSDLVENL
ncbi:MAG: IS1595 family transposase [Candidatus Dadabacteria bacterium]|nr:IS1595 family transposase [Candidatus Dadabacteria bacterium]